MGKGAVELLSVLGATGDPAGEVRRVEKKAGGETLNCHSSINTYQATFAPCLWEEVKSRNCHFHLMDKEKLRKVKGFICPRPHS